MKTLQPVLTKGGHGPILRNDTPGAQAVSGPQLSIGRAVRWSHLHRPCAQVWLNSAVCDKREKLPRQGMTELSPM